MQPTSDVKNLGIICDKNTPLVNDINTVFKNHHLKFNMNGSIRRYLTRQLRKVLVHGLIISKKNYVNSLHFFCLPKYLVEHWQLTQNQSARLIMQTRRHDHITPTLRELHWLPDSMQINSMYAVMYMCKN